MNLEEKIAKQLSFILDQQAQNEVRWAEADKRWAEADKRWAKLEQQWERTETSIRGLLAIVEAHEQQHEDVKVKLGTITDQIAALTRAGQRTDDRLNILIGIVERQISKDGGRPS